jgi:hypothetical protein
LVAPEATLPLTLAPPPYNGAVGFTVFNWLLPFLEQEPLYLQANRNVSTPIPNAAGPSTVFSVPVQVYLCPSDASTSNGRAMTPNGDANFWAVGNYAANYLLFGNPLADNIDAREQSSGRLQAVCSDGLSNTMAFSERYGTCGNSGVLDAPNVFGSLWSDSNGVWRPVVCINDPSQSAVLAGYPACLPPQVQPHWLSQCDYRRSQTPHTTLNVGLADASVRSMGPDITPTTWARLCDPRDGEPLPDGW